jgi:hypothetical protein
MQALLYLCICTCALAGLVLQPFSHASGFFPCWMMNDELSGSGFCAMRV